MSACPVIEGAVYMLRDALERGPAVAHCHGEDFDRVQATPVNPALTRERIGFAVNLAVNDLLVFAHVIPQYESPKTLVKRGLSPGRLDELEAGLQAFRDEMLIQRFEAKTRHGDHRDVFAENFRAVAQTRLGALEAMMRSARAYFAGPGPLDARAVGNAYGLFLQNHPSQVALAWIDLLVKYPEVPDA